MFRITLHQVYNYNPVPAVLNDSEKPYIKGVQTNLWTEYIPTPEKALYMLLPRMLAVAEIAWTPLNRKDLRDFLENRVPVHLNRLEKKGIIFRVPTPIGLSADTVRSREIVVSLKPPVHNAKLYYTMDGSEPNEAAMLYTKSIRVSLPAGQKIILKTVTVTPLNHRSTTTENLFLNTGESSGN